MTPDEAKAHLTDRIVEVAKDYPIDTALKAGAIVQVSAMYAIAGGCKESDFVEVCRNVFRAVRGKVTN